MGSQEADIVTGIHKMGAATASLKRVPKCQAAALSSQTATGLPTGMTVLTGSYMVKLEVDFALSWTSCRCQMEFISHASTLCSKPQTCQADDACVGSKLHQLANA